MGPMHGDPYCYCEMEARKLKPSPKYKMTPEQEKKFNDALVRSLNGRKVNDRDDVQRTFDRLRRSSYIEAVTAYTLARIRMPFGATLQDQDDAGAAALEKLGWTESELTEEGWRREREEGL